MQVGLSLFLLTSALHLCWSRAQRGHFPHKGVKGAEEDVVSGGGSTAKDVTVVTRIHKGFASSFPRLESILDFVVSSLKYATRVVVCVDVGGDELENAGFASELVAYLGNSEQVKASGKHVKVLRITPWGLFTPALNAALQYAVSQKSTFIAFQSLEFRIAPDVVSTLFGYFNSYPQALVVGPCVAGHDFSPGQNKLRGRTCPWNTFSIWSIKHLALTGFPMVGDGVFNSKMGGVEEVSAISLLQLINPSLRAILVKIKGVVWKTEFEDPARASYHEEKMKSKDERPMAQLKMLDMSGGSVFHVEHAD